MRKTLLALGAIGALFTVSACADDYGYYGAGYGPDAYYGAAYGPDDVFYDGFYGPYNDGYWGPDNAFYYRGGDGRFLRDDGGHFRHGMFRGAHHFRAGAHPGGGRDGDRH